jgi:hypothetical protein
MCFVRMVSQMVQVYNIMSNQKEQTITVMTALKISAVVFVCTSTKNAIVQRKALTTAISLLWGR